MDRKCKKDADVLIQRFLNVTLKDENTQRNLCDQYESMLQKHFQDFHSTILRSKMRGLITDAFMFGLRTGIYFAKDAENEKE